MMNSFGHIFRVTTWGESDGPALGATVDGVPPGVPLEAEAGDPIANHVFQNRLGEENIPREPPSATPERL